jgi:hypothetical protein
MARYKNALTGASAYAQQGNRGRKTLNPRDAGCLL